MPMSRGRPGYVLMEKREVVQREGGRSRVIRAACEDARGFQYLGLGRDALGPWHMLTEPR